MDILILMACYLFAGHLVLFERVSGYLNYILILPRAYILFMSTSVIILNSEFYTSFFILSTLLLILSIFLFTIRFVFVAILYKSCAFLKVNRIGFD